MAKKQKKISSEDVLKTAIKGIQEKKGENIVSLDLRNIKNRVCDYFIICDAQSTTQVNAIAHSVEYEVKKKLSETPFHHEGYENSEWILIDYVTVVVHVFQHDIRDFYNIEGLWADAEVKKYK